MRAHAHAQTQVHAQESELALVKWINALVSGDAIVTMQNEPEK